jgi:hypothetical protein
MGCRPDAKEEELENYKFRGRKRIKNTIVAETPKDGASAAAAS